MFACRMYNTDLELLQVCRGHEDSVRAILHIPEDDQVCVCGGKVYAWLHILLLQYVTAGWDKTLRIWSAYQPRTRNS